MAIWIKPVNFNDFDVFAAYQNLDSFYWTKGRDDIKKGDEVFLYIAKPIQKIMFRTVCIADDVSSKDKDWEKDKPYYKKQDFNDHSEEVLNCVDLKLIQKCDDDRLSFGFLKKENMLHDFTFRYAISNEKHKQFETLFQHIKTIFDEQNEIIQKIENETTELKGIDKLAYVKVRVNQTKFRTQLLAKYQKCCLCGIDEPKLLIASHIKPWSVSQDTEKLDSYNGLLFCPHHDKLFDLGLIGFDEQGKILISPKLEPHNQILLNLHEEMKIHVNEKHQHYLDFHRQNIFQAA
ncbi:EVE domain-containing protein [Wielerella bovis]|uniref:HNH endonuclease n=1 Tax=Wielerella bovis TaxID=2917790 RepID=UPI002019DB47|nr:HNH endonuclease [Wielerella bovis]ULJ69921.1 EVE domain-containing protein [Wielerella bovis]